MSQGREGLGRGRGDSTESCASAPRLHGGLPACLPQQSQGPATLRCALPAHGHVLFLPTGAAVVARGLQARLLDQGAALSGPGPTPQETGEGRSVGGN